MEPYDGFTMGNKLECNAVVHRCCQLVELKIFTGIKSDLSSKGMVVFGAMKKLVSPGFFCSLSLNLNITHNGS